MKYVYETHLHTVEASACARTKGEDYIDYMKGLGYSGIIVTDHFFTGNSCVPRDLSWEERVNIYCSGYEHALEKAGKQYKVWQTKISFRGVDLNEKNVAHRPGLCPVGVVHRFPR